MAGMPKRRRRRNRRNPGDVAYHFDWDDEEWTVFIKGDWHGNASSANDAVNEADAALQEIHGYSPKEADRAAVSAMESYLAHNAMEWDY